MERTDLEEGEAYPFPDDDQNIDPDEALSYIDERIHNVLGHYLKDFEGGFSAESLGARFGGYGSFLPVHWRSPSILSSSKTPQEVGSRSIQRPMHNCPSEGAHQNSMILLSETLHRRHEPDSDSAPPPLVSGTSMDSSDMPFNLSNHKMLKFRIKMGSESLLARKNVEIYSGLDISSRSSLEESAALCKGNLAESQEALGESPSCIIKMMTSFPFPDVLLLSPLGDSLVHLLEEENYPKSTRSRTVQESSSILGNEFAPEKGSREVFRKKKLKLKDKNRSSVEMINESCEDLVNVVDTHPKQEIDIQNSTAKEIISNALKLQLTFDEKDKVHNAVEGTGSTSKAKMDVVKRRIGASDLVKEGTLELISHEQANWTHMRNAKTGLFEKVCEDKRAGLDIRDGEAKVDISYVSSKVDYDIPKTVKGLAVGTTRPARQKFNQKGPSHLQDRLKNSHGKEHPSSEGQKKLKGSQSDGISAAESPKKSLMAGYSTAPKDKIACSSCFPAIGERNDVKSYQDLRKVRDYHSDFVGKMKLGKLMDSMDTPLNDRGKLSKIGEAEKEMKAFIGKSKEISDGKKAGSLSTFDMPLKGDPNDTALTENGPDLNVFPTEAAPVLIKENWVCCDKCHKWRLLPYGTNPNHLPKKWLCSMLNWLPGMNKCSFSEEQTTNALNALYQVPISDIQINQLSCPDGVASDVTLTSAQHLDKIRQEVGFNAVPGGGKKKQGLRAASGADDTKPLKMKSKREAGQYGFGVKQKAKKKSMHYTFVVQNPGGSTKQTRIDDQKYNEHSSPWYSQDLAKDVSLASIEKQKNLAEKLVAREEYITRDISGSNRKLECQSTQTYPGIPLSKPKQTKIDDQKDNNCSSSRYSQAKDGSLASKEKQKKLAEKTVIMEGLGKKDISSKKRKLKDFQGTQIYSATPLHKHQTERKASELNYQEKAFNRSKEIDRQDRKDKANMIALLSDGNCRLDDYEQHEGGSIENDRLQGQDHANNLSISTLDGKSCLRKDLGSGQTFVATTSSSSKVSGTCKIKVCFRKVKGSQSVTSSPLRISSPDNLSKSLSGMDDASSAGFSLTNSQRRGSEGKCDDGSDRSETVRKEKSIHRRPKISGSSNEEKDLHPMESLKYNMQSKSPDCAPYKEEMDSVNFKTQGGYNIKSEKVQKSYVGRKVSPGKHLHDCRKRGYQSDSEQHKDPHAKLDTKLQDGKSTAGKNLLQNHENERPSSCFPSNRVDGGDSRRGKSTYFTSHCSIPVSEKVGGLDVLSIDGSDGQDGAETQKQLRKAGSHNEFHQVSFRLPTPIVYGPNDIKARSPLKKDTSRAANNALKEAKDLKHSANHLKISGSGLGSTELFFQAALKFLHGALLLEHCNTDTANYGEKTSMEVYGTTARLCEYCAHEFERCKDMASAALAYKCTEVSYMRLIYSNDFIASRDRHELQMALQMVPSVESPSSSASDVDNLNFQAIMEKMYVSKDVDSPQLTGNHVIAARNQPHFVRLLNFAQDVNIAMEASRKSQDAFAAASVVLAEAGNREGITSVKRVLDLSFQDLEGLLRLVHHTMETLNG